MSHYCIFSKKPSTSAKKCFIFQYFQWLFGLFALSHHPHSNCPHRIEPAKNECNGTQILICTVCNLHKGHVFFLSSSTFRHIFVQLSVHFARLFDSFHVSPICHFLCFFCCYKFNPFGIVCVQFKFGEYIEKRSQTPNQPTNQRRYDPKIMRNVFGSVN